MPKQYFPAIEKGIIESMKKGVLGGFPVTNIKATLLDNVIKLRIFGIMQVVYLTHPPSAPSPRIRRRTTELST